MSPRPSHTSVKADITVYSLQGKNYPHIKFMVFSWPPPILGYFGLKNSEVLQNSLHLNTLYDETQPDQNASMNV